MAGNPFFAQFTYLENWDVVYSLILVVIGIGYLYLVGPYRVSNGKEVVEGEKKFYFILGLWVYYMAQGSPLAMMGHELFSVHMLQMSLLYLVVPPLILAGLPAWVVRPIVTHRLIKPVFRFFTSPLIALVLFNGFISIYHFPFIFDSVMSSSLLHVISHLLLLLASFAMWWPLLCPIPELDRLSGLQKMGYIFADGVLLTPACAMLIFAGTLLYDSYQGSHVFPMVETLADQQLGGVIMKIMQEISYGIVLGTVFFQWVAKEKVKNEKEKIVKRDESNEYSFQSTSL
ncbi:cytochrome c oxidase assembly protein [Mechercharimyces sp. CAU 1602]|uniref:cytochrome c oxidase assembly protein n=1 Tax=Mechercharimyces sp. CAU 1602 TaxID=2973933 RepID=UPI002161DE68|nr:cytochrome c oxidase assembly protein [Mechercharimyces sp. CAU 1602]MCS1352759.1 cytochrome c oxidase assembly protein [Mechercharimyces sp. CAU 1602]